MTDEAKPPQKKPADAPRRPRKPAADGAKRPRKTPALAKEPAETAAEPAAEMAAAEAPDEEAAAAAPATPDADAEATAALPPDAAATQVVAPDVAATQVLPGTDAGPTQVMPSGGGAPPPFAPVPRVVTPSGGGDRRSLPWIVLAVAAIAIVAIVLAWAFAMRDSGEQFVGTWAPVSGEGGGLVIEMQDGGYDVSVYDPDLKAVGTYPAVRDGDTLTFRFSKEEAGLGLLEARLTYMEDRDVLLLQLAGMGEEGAAMEYVRVDALEAAPTPSAMPTPTSTPTASPTASPTGSPSPSPSPTSTDTSQNDERVIDGIVVIQVGVLNWAQENGGFPPPAEVSQQAGVGQYVTPWPTNPYTGQPMVAGDQPGDYTYEQLNGGQGYELVGHLANDFTFTVP